MCSDLTLGPSFKVKQGYPNLEVLIARLLLVLEVCNVKPTYRKSWDRNRLMWSNLTLGPPSRSTWAGNLLMFSDLTLGPSFKVKRWFTGFGELSFRWIQICSGSSMYRSSSMLRSTVNASSNLIQIQIEFS